MGVWAWPHQVPPRPLKQVRKKQQVPSKPVPSSSKLILSLATGLIILFDLLKVSLEKRCGKLSFQEPVLHMARAQGRRHAITCPLQQALQHHLLHWTENHTAASLQHRHKLHRHLHRWAQHRVTTGSTNSALKCSTQAKSNSQQTLKTAMKGRIVLNQQKFGYFLVVPSDRQLLLEGEGQSLNCKQESFKVGDKEAEPAAGKKRSCTGNKAHETSRSAMSAGHTNRPSSACPNLIWGPKLLKYYCYWRSLTRTHLCDLEESEFNKISI